MLENYYKILSAHLTEKHWKRHYYQIVFNLDCVNKGYKPSFLWDIGPCLDVNILKNLIQDFKHSSVLHSFIYLVKIYDEIFVLNVVKFFKHFDNLNVKIINCSSDLDTPQMLDDDSYEKAMSMICFVKDRLFDHFNYHTEKNTHPDLFVNLNFGNNIVQSPPTVFGVLLGYPVVYWLNDINGNCLSNIPLTVYKVQIFNDQKSVIQREIDLYSFSAPTCLNLSIVIEDWIVMLKRTASTNFKLISNTVINSCVQL